MTLLLTFQGHLRSNLIVHFTSHDFIFVFKSNICPATLSEMSSDFVGPCKIWGTLHLTYEGLSRSNLMVLLDAPYDFPLVSYSNHMSISFTRYKGFWSVGDLDFDLKSGWPWVWPFKVTQGHPDFRSKSRSPTLQKPLYLVKEIDMWLL